MKELFFTTIISCLLFSQTRTVDAVKSESAISIDAIAEEAWNSAQSYTDFVQHDPIPLSKPTEKTTFKFMYDDDNIYFYVKSYTNPNDISTESGKRDQAFNNDWILISISPLLDGNTGYSFLINPSNTQADARLSENGNEDWNWDAIWYSEARIDDDGWSAEFKIPLRAIKFQAKDVQDWGLNVIRYMRNKNEKVFWQEIDPDVGYRISSFAKIVGIEGIKSKNEIQVIPSAVSAFDSDLDYDPTLSNRNFGADIKFNLNETHSVLATIKPDFAQIEADADEVNLSSYPLFLREKRPFFLRGNDLYRMPDEVFYSRRMASPDIGAKFFGSVGKLQYGMTYVRNDMSTEYKRSIERDPVTQVSTLADTIAETHKEDFFLTRVTYNEPQKFQIGYLNAIVNSDLELSGMLHAIDAKYYPQDNLRLTFLAATTVLSDDKFESNQLERYTYYGSTVKDLNVRGNRSLRMQMNYNTDTWYSYFRFQKKSEHFEQGLIGFPEPSNRTEQNFNLGRKWRFKDSFWRQARVNVNVNHTGTYDNYVQSFNYNFNAHANHQFDEIGFVGYGAGINFNDGYFRFYDFDDDIVAIHSDNYGEFIAADNHGISAWSYFETDFSKTFAFHVNPWYGYGRGFDEVGSSFTFQWRPNSHLKTKLNFNYQSIENSKYFDWDGIYRSYRLRTEYAITPEIFAKHILQYNPQDERLSNNMIITYEYIRGSFIYFSYNESGLLEEDYNKGTILENYHLENRTISLKATYSLFL